MAQKGDLVYFDPPYDVEENQSNFTEYTKGGFNRDDQTELKGVCDTLIDRGVWVAISNSNTSFIRELYKRGDAYSLYKVIDENKLRLARTIGAKPSSRGHVNELLIIGKPMERRKKRFLKERRRMRYTDGYTAMYLLCTCGYQTGYLLVEVPDTLKPQKVLLTPVSR